MLVDIHELAILSQDPYILPTKSTVQSTSSPVAATKRLFIYLFIYNRHRTLNAVTVSKSILSPVCTRPNVFVF